MEDEGFEDEGDKDEEGEEAADDELYFALGVRVGFFCLA